MVVTKTETGIVNSILIIRLGINQAEIKIKLVKRVKQTLAEMGLLFRLHKLSSTLIKSLIQI